MPLSKRTKKVQVKVESSIDDDVDILPVHLDGWKNASKADKSRIAAKWRRDREVEYLDKLSALLPFPIDVTSKLDKGSILRLTITYLQLKNDVCRITGESRPQVFSQVTHVIDQHKTDHTYSHSNSKRDSGNMNQMLKVNEPELMLHALGGFLLYINRKGRILYVSENVNTHLGFHQYDMIGKKVLAFIHHDDHKELTKQFMISMPPSMSLPTTDEVDENEDEDPDSINPDTFVSQRPAFYLRMRYQIMKKGSKTKHTGYLLSQWSGRIRLAPSKSNPGHSSIVGMVTICRPLQSTSLLEIRLDGNMFMSRHTLDLKFTFCDPRILTLVGYEPSELVGKTVYHFHNPLDAQKIQSCHANLIARGQSVSKYYRFLGKTGEWVWMQTRATVIYNTTNQPQYVVCMNYVIGQDEGRRHLMMEQEELKDQDIPKGAIDVTSLSSPGPAHSSGYCSADEDHSYSSSKTQEAYSPGVQSPGTQSSLDTGSQPQTPPSANSPVDQSLSDAVSPTVLGEKMQGFNTEDLNLFDMIGDIMPQSSLPTSSSLPQTGSCSIADSWFNSLSNEIEMMDVDENSGLSSALDVGSDGEGILINMIKNSEKTSTLQQTSDDKQNVGGTTERVISSLSSLMTPQSSAAVITQSNVMLSSATVSHNSGTMGSSKQRTGSSTQLKNAIDKSHSIMVPMSIASGMDSSHSKASITMAEFSSGMMADSDGSVIENNNEFALKFAENMVDQQINATLANYLTDGDNLMEGGNLGVQDASLNGLSDNTFNLLDDDSIINNNSSSSSSLSQFLTSSNPIVSSSSSSIIATSGQPNCSSYQIPTSATSKQMKFATPQAPPPVSAHMPRHNSMSNLNPKPSVSISRTISHPQLQKLSMQTSNKSQQQSHTAVAYPGCDDHRYTSKQLESPPHNHKSNNHRNGHRSNSARHQNYSHHNMHNNHNLHASHNHNHQPRLLEKFLLTKEKLNPNKGSDAALAAQGISQLQLDDGGGRMDQNDALEGNQQLLKKLLTEEILPKDVHKAQQEVIMDRRQSAGSSPSCTSPTLINSFSLDTDDLSSSIQLLSEDNSDEMDKLWTPLSGDDETVPSELDEILREEMRQNDLWLQHCINELL